MLTCCAVSLSGDLSRPVEDSGLFRQFVLPMGSLEVVLDESVSLNVREDGIIGRRVSMTRGRELLADGIVGFNF